MRQKRKMDHINWALELEDTGPSGFNDLYLVPEAVPELRLEQVDSSCFFLQKKLSAPLLINAMTGGHPDVLEINAALGEAARRTGVAVAVGSQRAALEDPGVARTYSVVREKNPGGVVLANLNAGCGEAEARRVVGMVEADGLQLYLNVAQELSMSEGDVDFTGVLNNISYLAHSLPVPVIVKEVGFGISRETILKLAGAGVSFFDVGGRGGTNFAAIEGMRRGRTGVTFTEWGMPTAVTLLEALSVPGIRVIATGGIRTAMDVVKALVAGASLAGMARPLLQVLLENSVDALVDYIEQLKEGLRHLMLALGAATVGELPRKNLVITGFTAQWLEQRGIKTGIYANR